MKSHKYYSATLILCAAALVSCGGGSTSSSVVSEVSMLMLADISDQTALVNSNISITPVMTNPDELVISYQIMPSVLPSGLMFDTSTGELSGVPDTVGVTQFSLLGLSSSGLMSNTVSFNVDVSTSSLSTGIASAVLPTVDEDGRVVWPFAPQDSGLDVHIEPFVELPLGENGSPARWNDMALLNERLFVLEEQGGRVFEITGGQSSLWFNVASAIQSNTGRQLDTANSWHGGLRSLAFHPNFNSNGKFYTSVMETRPAQLTDHKYLSGGENSVSDSVLIEWTADTNSAVVDITSYREVFRVGVPSRDHPVKQIKFDPYLSADEVDYGLLYIAHGDGTEEGNDRGGELNDALGKILRIDPLVSGSDQYTIPADNPFVGDSQMLDEVYSLGHRNPHNLAFSKDHTLLVTEVGHDNIDEVNVVLAGRNYGWSNREGAYVHRVTGGIFNGISALQDNDAASEYVYPVAQYGHYGAPNAVFIRVALAGGYVVENGSPLDGEYFYLEFATTGDLFHSSLSALKSAVTEGDPATLTVAPTWRAWINFDHDSNPATEPLRYSSLKPVISSANVFSGDRLDLRIGRGPLGELYLSSKRNNMIYRVTSSLPGGPGGFVNSSPPSDIMQPPVQPEQPLVVGEALYKSSCGGCHSGSGVPGAPLLGDDAAWTERLAAAEGGIEGLTNSVVNGIRGMPAFGDSAYTRQELLEAVDYLLGESG